MFGWFKKKVVEEVQDQPKVIENEPIENIKKDLTYAERVEIFKDRNKELIAELDLKMFSQKTFEIGELVKYDLLNSPIMKVVGFSSYYFSYWDVAYRFYSKSPSIEDVMIDIHELKAEIWLEYFDTNNVLQKITTTSDKVIKL